MEPIERKTLENILNFTQHLDMLDEEQQVQFEIIDRIDKKIEKQGAFMVEAPYYLVLSALPTDGYLVNAGFLMGQVMLYLMTKGLGSCFMQYQKLPLHHMEGFEPVVVLAFGNTDKNIYGDRKKVKRLPLKDLCSFKAVVDDEIKEILNAARMAPSFMNNQPWRFVVYENRIHLFNRRSKILPSSMKKLDKVDVGISLANIYMAAEELWYTCHTGRLESVQEQEFKNNEYLLTVFLKK